MATFLDDPNQVGLLSLGLRLMSTPGKFGTALGQSGLGAMGDMQQAKLAKQAAEQRAAQQQLLQMQMQQMIAQQADAKRKQAEAERLKAEQDAFLGGGMGLTTTPQQALAGGGGPTMENAAALNTPQPFPFAKAVQLFGIENAQKMAGARDWGRPEVARTIKGMQGGREVETQYDKFGRAVGGGIEQYRAPLSINQGNKTTLADPYSFKTLQEFQQFQSPDSVASTALTRRGQDLQDARSRESNAITTQNGRIPTGYRMKPDGNLEAIPGGPADIKAGEAGAKAEQKKAATIDQAKNVLETVKEATNLVGITTAGVGGYAAKLPATEARDLKNKLDTIKANLGFDRLQQMRDNSPTGGALGQVAVQEINALQATVASLDQMQSPAQLLAGLAKIKKHYENWLKTVGGNEGGASGSYETESKVRRYNPATGRIE